MTAFISQETPTTPAHMPMRPGSCSENSSTVVSVDGPAISGIASGTMKGSPSGPSAKAEWCVGKIICMAIRNSTMPPATDMAVRSSASAETKYLPNSRKKTMIPSAMNSSRAITARRRSSPTFLSALMNSGMLPSGSMTSVSVKTVEIKSVGSITQ